MIRDRHGITAPSKSHLNPDESKHADSKSFARPTSWWNIARTGHPQHGYGQIANASHVLSAISCPNAAAIFIKRNVADPMQAVFNGPLTSNDFQQSGRTGLFKGQTGYPIDSFSAFFA
jgi:hypothetical protein